MLPAAAHAAMPARPMPSRRSAGRLLLIALMAFLTVADLFATQAILPALTLAYHTTPAMMSLAVNASTLGMALAGLAMSLAGRHVPRRSGITASLLLLAIPTLLLSLMPDLPVFMALRVIQGLCMATAFTLTLAHIGEATEAHLSAAAFAAYIAGNVGSNLFGRLLSAAAADHFGLGGNFLIFAALNGAGAALACFALRRSAEPQHSLVMNDMDMGGLGMGGMGMGGMAMKGAWGAWRANARDPAMRAAFALGFCILFAFIGTFSYVNFVLARPPFGLGMMALGWVYLVFAPSIVTTPLAGGAVRSWGAKRTCLVALLLAAAGLPLLLLASLAAVIAGLVCLGIGTFFAQAVATGFVARNAPADRAAASGMYLGCYFLGGLAGSLGLGLTFDRLGWPACVAGIGLALAAGMTLTQGLNPRD